jgi:hypothetical protein
MKSWKIELVNYLGPVSGGEGRIVREDTLSYLFLQLGCQRSPHTGARRGPITNGVENGVSHQSIAMPKTRLSIRRWKRGVRGKKQLLKTQTSASIYRHDLHGLGRELSHAMMGNYE